MQRTKTNITEEVFLLSTFSEFAKCWKSGKRARMFMDTVNGEAFINFSVFLGKPSEVHSYSSRRQGNPNPSPKEKNKRKKSPRKIQRDNERAAKFQEEKRKEDANAGSGVPPPATSTPAAPSISAASIHFSFASPAPEDVTSKEESQEDMQVSASLRRLLLLQRLFR